MVLIGLFGTLLGDPKVLLVALMYFIVFASVMFMMLERMFLLRMLMFILQSICPSRQNKNEDLLRSDDISVHTGARGGRTITKVCRSHIFHSFIPNYFH